MTSQRKKEIKLAMRRNEIIANREENHVALALRGYNETEAEKAETAELMEINYILHYEFHWWA